MTFRVLKNWLRFTGQSRADKCRLVRMRNELEADGCEYRADWTDYGRLDIRLRLADMPALYYGRAYAQP